MKYTICPQCQTENSGSQLVCNSCGTSLAGVLRQERPETAEYFTPSAPLPGIPLSTGYSTSTPVPVQTATLKASAYTRMVKGANWFFWIAGLSVVNSVLARIGQHITFVLGLGTTQFIDGFALGAIRHFPDIAVFIHAVVIALDLIILGLLALFGVLGRKGYRPVFIIGIILYAMDLLIYIWVRDYIACLFHLLALWGIFSGLRASFEYAKLNAPQSQMQQFNPIQTI